MKIKKHGKLFDKEIPIHTEKFKCDSCGCEFTCKDDEYYTDYCGADWHCGSGCITTTTYTISSTSKDYLVCSCPECHKIVKKIRERKNNSWFTTTTTPLTYPYSINYTKEDKDFTDFTTITCDVIGKTESSEL